MRVMLVLQRGLEHLQKVAVPVAQNTHSASLEVVAEVVPVQEDEENAAADEEDEGPSDDEEAQSQGTVSLLDISNSDNEEACKAAAHEKVCKSDVQFTAWQD